MTLLLILGGMTCGGLLPVKLLLKIQGDWNVPPTFISLALAALIGNTAAQHYWPNPFVVTATASATLISLIIACLWSVAND